VAEVISGYKGWHKDNPTYEEVSAGATGQAGGSGGTFQGLVFKLFEIAATYAGKLWRAGITVGAYCIRPGVGLQADAALSFPR